MNSELESPLCQTAGLIRQELWNAPGVSLREGDMIFREATATASGVVKPHEMMSIFLRYHPGDKKKSRDRLWISSNERSLYPDNNYFTKGQI